MYKALNARGEPTRGVMRAAHEREVEAELKKISYVLITCKEYPERKVRLTGLLVKGVKRRELIQVFLQMEQLLKVGVPLLTVLDHVRTSAESQRLHDVMMEIGRVVSEGKPLSEALADYPWVFGQVVIKLVAGSEETGNLGDSCREVVRQLKWEDRMQRRVKKAMRYPKILLTVLLVVLWVMMSYVVPKITGFLRSMDQELPPVTRALMWTSDFVIAYGFHIAGALIGVYVFIRVGRAMSGGFVYATDAVTLRMPVIGEVVRKIALSRFCQMFGVLYARGVDMLKCLEVARETTGNAVIVEALKVIYDRVQEGQVLSEAMVGSGEFPTLVTQMVKIGEESGNLTKVMEEVSEFYDKDVDEAVEGMISLIEPCLTVVMGGLVVWIAAGVFGPVYDSFSKMNV